MSPAWCLSGGDQLPDHIEELDAIMDRFSVHTKTEAVYLALRNLAGQPMTREEAVAMRGARAIGEVPADTALFEVS